MKHRCSSIHVCYYVIVYWLCIWIVLQARLDLFASNVDVLSGLSYAVIHSSCASRLAIQSALHMGELTWLLRSEYYISLESVNRFAIWLRTVALLCTSCRINFFLVVEWNICCLWYCVQCNAEYHIGLASLNILALRNMIYEWFVLYQASPEIHLSAWAAVEKNHIGDAAVKDPEHASGSIRLRRRTWGRVYRYILYNICDGH